MARDWTGGLIVPFRFIHAAGVSEIPAASAFAAHTFGDSSHVLSCVEIGGAVGPANLHPSGWGRSNACNSFRCAPFNSWFQVSATSADDEGILASKQ